MGEPGDSNSPRRSRSKRSCKRSPSSGRRSDRSSEKPRKDAFGRTVVGRSRASSSSSAQRQKRKKRRSNSRNSRSPRNRSNSRNSRSPPRNAKGGMPPPGFPPPMYPGMPFPPPMYPGMPGYAYPPMWGWPGMPPPDPRGGDNRRSDSRDRRRPRGRRRGRSGSRSRSRSRSYRRSRSRGDFDDSVLIGRNIMGRVIGKGGVIINRIREESGARIDAEDRDEDYCEFRISGTDEQVRRAKNLILDQADKAAHPSTSAGSSDRATSSSDVRLGEDAITETLDFPIGLIGGIIGARGAKINEVRQRTGANIQVDKTEDKCKVLISGSDAEVDRAVRMVKSLAEEAEASAADPDGSADDGGCNERMEFPLAAAGRIIGSRGSQISEVRMRSGALVKVEKLDDCCRVHLSGSPEQVDRAREMIKALVEDSQVSGDRKAEAEETIEIPQTMVGRVIGKGGETVHRLQRDSGAKIDVNAKLDPAPVRLAGSKEAVQRAQWMIREVMDHNTLNGVPLSGGAPPAYPGYAAGPWGMWPHGAAGYPPPGGGYPPPGAAWGEMLALPAPDSDRGKDEEIDLDEL